MPLNLRQGSKDNGILTTKQNEPRAGVKAGGSLILGVTLNLLHA